MEHFKIKNQELLLNFLQKILIITGILALAYLVSQWYTRIQKGQNSR